MVAGFLLVLVASNVFASGLPTPGAALIFNSLGFILLATGAVCVVAVGFASLTTSRAGAIVTLIAWQIVASPLLSSIGSLGSARRLILSQAIGHFSPVSTEGRHGTTVAMSTGTALIVMIGWLLIFLMLGAWRHSRDGRLSDLLHLRPRTAAGRARQGRSERRVLCTQAIEDAAFAKPIGRPRPCGARDPQSVVVTAEVLKEAGRLGLHDLSDPVEHQAQLLLGAFGCAHLDHMPERLRVGGPDDVGAEAVRREAASAEVTSFLTWKGTPRLHLSSARP